MLNENILVQGENAVNVGTSSDEATKFQKVLTGRVSSFGVMF